VSARADHVPEIDWLKGLAILLVMGIHAKLLEGTLFHQHLINRAVPFFLTLFPVTAELVERRAKALTTTASTIAWYRKRLERLYVPYWAMAAMWWVLVIATGNAEQLGLGPGEALVTATGFAPWMGTTWFVLMILQVVVSYPALRWAFERLGAVLSLGVTAYVCWVSNMHLFDVAEWAIRLLGVHSNPPGFYYVWIFFPRILWNLAGGYFIAKWWSGRPPPLATGIAGLITVAGSVLVEHLDPHDFMKAFYEQTDLYLLDVPRTVLFLGLFRYLGRVPIVPAFLAWCGLSSWGLYLGHALLHEIVHAVFHAAPEGGPQSVRFVYWLVLFAFGATLTVGGTKLQTLLRRSLVPETAPPA
jgi:peptidoglycan/LPS O-acetylase OafA/YrhL